MEPKKPKAKKEFSHIDLTPHLTKRFKPYPRKVGRYSPSEAWSIINGYTTPEQWLNAAPPDFEGMIRMWNGIQGHNAVQDLLDKAKCENKKEYSYGEIVVAGKADYLPNDDEVWEFKTSADVMTSAKPWHIHQAKMYCTMFERETGLVLQPLMLRDKFVLRELARVKRDDAWFEEQMAKIVAFHEQVKALAARESLPKNLPDNMEVLEVEEVIKDITEPSHESSPA